jgi:hypothetical protein
MPGSRLAKQVSEAIAACERIGAPFALIGGLALASHGVIRATQDVDLLIDLDYAEQLDRELRRLGYVCLHRSQDAGNYARQDERLDLLYASRPIARRLLADAGERQTPMGRLRVVSAEGVIGFKLQALVNSPKRMQDLEDIRALLRVNRGALNMSEVAEYFRLFDREAQLDELLREID